MKRIHNQMSLVALLLALALLVLGLPLGCAVHAWHGFPEPSTQQRVWPQPPEPARLAYVMQIRSHEDLFQNSGFWRSLGELVGGKPDSTLVRPYALAIHPAGGLLVADSGRQCVHFYHWSRGLYIRIGAQRKGGLPSPVGVTALNDGRILVSDSRLGSVESFNENGRYLGAFCAAGTFQRPAGIVASEGRGEVYVADVLAHCVRVFDLHGAPLRKLGRHGSAPGQFNYPTNLALDGQGRLVVTDSLNFRLQILQPDGAFVSSFGELGDTPGKFSRPKGVAVDEEGHIIVVEGLFDAVQFFNPDGRFLLTLGGGGHGPGEFWLPAGICYDRKERLLFVADSYNKRIQVFRLLPTTPPGQ